jgi:hypothetical protein
MCSRRTSDALLKGILTTFFFVFPMHNATRSLAIALLVPDIACYVMVEVAGPDMLCVSRYRFGSARCAKFQLGVASPVLFIKTPLM